MRHRGVLGSSIVGGAGGALIEAISSCSLSKYLVLCCAVAFFGAGASGLAHDFSPSPSQSRKGMLCLEALLLGKPLL